MQWRRYLRDKTQQPRFLWSTVAGILAAGAVLGLVASLLPTPAPTDRLFGLSPVEQALLDGTPPLALLDRLLDGPGAPLEDALELLPYLQLAGPAVESVVAQRLAAAPRDAHQRQVAEWLWTSLVERQPADELLAEAEASPPVRYANYALGVYWRFAERPAAAAEAFQREGQLPEARRARRQAIEIHRQRNDRQALERLAQEPLYADEMPAVVRRPLAADRGDWWTVWWLIPRGEWEQLQPDSAALALVTGLCWFVFIVQAGYAGAPGGTRWPLAIAAVLLGALSVWLTHLLIEWQRVQWGLTPADGLRETVLYFVLGVGLREEFAKLVLLLPLVPWFVRRPNELEVLVVSACVGLGFAAVENERYFSMTFGAATVGRFLTANFFHMAATGLVGLAVARAAWDPRRHGTDAIGVFLLVVLAHGAYDAFLMLDAIAESSFLAMVVYILLALWFFRELKSARRWRQETVSLTATFLWSISLVAAVTFVYLSAYFGATTAFQWLGVEALSMAVMAYLFLREMPNSLV